MCVYKKDKVCVCVCVDRQGVYACGRTYVCVQIDRNEDVKERRCKECEERERKERKRGSTIQCLSALS